MIAEPNRAAQHAAGADAAVRPKDQTDFETRIWLDRFTTPSVRRSSAPGRWGAPIKTGKLSGVQVPDEEGPANHLGPVSCADAGNSASEALIGERAGPVLSPEISVQLPGADAVPTRGKQHHPARSGKGCLDPAGSETWACTDAS